jgi:hypothetical protein
LRPCQYPPSESINFINWNFSWPAKFEFFTFYVRTTDNKSWSGHEIAKIRSPIPYSLCQIVVVQNRCCHVFLVHKEKPHLFGIRKCFITKKIHWCHMKGSVIDLINQNKDLDECLLRFHKHQTHDSETEDQIASWIQLCLQLHVFSR